MNKKIVLVTGSYGFLAQNLILKLLKLNYYVLGIDQNIKGKFNFNFDKYIKNKKFHNIIININNYKKICILLNKYKIFCCFHLAAITQVNESDRNPVNNFKTNIIGTINLLEYFRLYSNKTIFIFSSSDKAYGKYNKLPYKETYPLNGLHPYDVSKSSADKIVQTYNYHYNLKTSVTRSVNIYGPGDMNSKRLIPETIISLLKNKKINLRSDGKYIRDYIFVDDLVNGYVKLLNYMKSNNVKLNDTIFNFGTGKKIKVIEIVKKILKKLNKDKNYFEILNIANNEINNQYTDYNKAKKLLNWKPTTNIDKGLNYTIEWYKKNYFKK